MTGNELRNYRYQTPPLHRAPRRGPNNDIMSQGELASLIGIHRNTLSLYENKGDDPIPNWVPTALIGVETLVRQHAESIKEHEDRVRSVNEDEMGNNLREIDMRTSAELTTGEDIY